MSIHFTNSRSGEDQGAQIDALKLFAPMLALITEFQGCDASDNVATALETFKIIYRSPQKLRAAQAEKRSPPFADPSCETTVALYTGGLLHTQARTRSKGPCRKPRGLPARPEATRPALGARVATAILANSFHGFARGQGVLRHGFRIRLP